MAKTTKKSKKKPAGKPKAPLVQAATTAAPTSTRVPAWRIVNRQQLAELLGVHPDTVTDHARSGMPVMTMGGRGRESEYDAVECVGWWRSKQGKNLKETAQTRAFEASAQLNELKLARERGELVPSDQVIAAGQAYTKAWTAMLRALPRQLVQAGVVSREIEPQITERVRNILMEIASFKTMADAEAAAGAALAETA